MSLPDAIGWWHGDSFAGRTVRRRFPGMIDLLAEGNPDLDRPVRALRELVTEMVGDGVLRVDRFERPTPYWADWLAERDGARFGELSFFEIEFVFHHAINSYCGSYPTGRDPFEFLKRREAEAALARVAAMRPDSLPAALRQALFANIADASQLTNPGHGELGQPLVVDESDRALALLAGQPVFLLADNTGLELGLDLLLVDRLVRDGPVTLAVKPWPLFVSDATVRDVDAQLDLWRASELRAVAGRLDAARRDGRLTVRDDPDWGEPRFFQDLSLTLADALADQVVISKGDLNYRRYFGDRQWPYDTPIQVAAGSIAFRSVLLRVLKSDILVGVDLDRARAIERDDPHWLTDSRYAVIQVSDTRRSEATDPARSDR
ncbi:MAG TPA: ARMT1-like domain-containing protein [Pseudonocardiaceae bacterium]